MYERTTNQSCNSWHLTRGLLPEISNFDWANRSNPNLICADVENLAGGSDRVGEKQHELTLMLRTTMASTKDHLVWSAGPNALENAPSMKTAWEARGWKYIEPFQGLSGPDKSLAFHLLTSPHVLRASHLIILGGDGEFLEAVQFAIRKGTRVTVVGLWGDTAKSFRKTGATVVELTGLYGLDKLL